MDTIFCSRARVQAFIFGFIRRLGSFHKEVAMGFKEDYPEFSAIERHIRRAHAERSVAIAHAIAGFLAIVGRGIRKLGSAHQLSAIADRRAIEADAFLKRSVPKY
jgi:hypothetical protein